MSKNIFNPVEIVNLTARKFKVKAPVFEGNQDVPPGIYEGPTADDLRREAELFKKSWESEKSGMIEDAKAEAEKIIQEARDQASKELEEQNTSRKVQQENIEFESERLLSEARKKAEEIINKAHEKEENIQAKARQIGIEEGHEAGWSEGNDEIKRLSKRLQKVLDTAIARRSEILAETESQIVDLILLIVRKVVKVMSESHRKVVLNNVTQALKKLRNRGEVNIRVNLADLEICTKHKRDFIELMENIESVSILEDSAVEPGGAIIETDFGYIDARIQSQLREIEDKIVELAPLYENNRM